MMYSIKIVKIHKVIGKCISVLKPMNCQTGNVILLLIFDDGKGNERQQLTVASSLHTFLWEQKPPIPTRILPIDIASSKSLEKLKEKYDLRLVDNLMSRTVRKQPCYIHPIYKNPARLFPICLRKKAGRKVDSYHNDYKKLSGRRKDCR